MNLFILVESCQKLFFSSKFCKVLTSKISRKGSKFSQILLNLGWICSIIVFHKIVYQNFVATLLFSSGGCDITVFNNVATVLLLSMVAMVYYQEGALYYYLARVATVLQY
jgi:hypothetical protein